MPNIVPGAIWQPIDVGNRAARRKGRGLIGHVAVSNAVNLKPGGPVATRSADWHFYLPKDPQPGGRFYQYIDLDQQCWSSQAGNATCPAFESQGGMGTTAQVNAEPWTANQVESAAIILAHLNRTEGVPLQDMGNSLASSRGMAVHRYGIAPWRVAGGEVWASSNGKLCPGDAKVRQIPQIIARAREILGGTPSGDDDMNAAQEGVLQGILNWIVDPNVGIIKQLGDVRRTLGMDDPDKNGQDRLGDLWEQADRNTTALLAAVGGGTGKVDAAAIAAAIPDDIAKQVADELIGRLKS